MEIIKKVIGWAVRLGIVTLVTFLVSKNIIQQPDQSVTDGLINNLEAILTGVATLGWSAWETFKKKK